MTILYFTATGNSLYIAKSMSESVLSIPALMKEEQYEIEDDAVGIVFPCYSGTVPLIVERFLGKTKINAPYKFAIATYGAIPGIVLKNFKQIANSNGLNFDYLNQIMMVDNYLPMFDMEKELAGAHKKNIDENFHKIKNEIRSKVAFEPKHGFFDNLIGSMMTKGAGKMLGGDVDKRFRVDSSCNLCGTCKLVCPVGNIKVDGTVVYQHNCEGCFACIHSCPQKSIHLQKEKNNTRFRNENVGLNEIVASNRQ